MRALAPNIPRTAPAFLPRMSQNTPQDFEELRAQPHRSTQTDTKADRHSASKHPPPPAPAPPHTQRQTDTKTDRHSTSKQGPPLSPRMVKGFAPKDLLAHAEAPASKDTNEGKAHPTTPTLSRQTRLPQDLPGDCEGTCAEFGKDFFRIP